MRIGSAFSDRKSPCRSKQKSAPRATNQPNCFGLTQITGETRALLWCDDCVADRVHALGVVLVRLTISASIFLAVLAPSVAAATPISDFDHPILVEVLPPGHSGSPHLRLDYAEYFADLPDFFRGMGPATLPEGFMVHGHGVALFYRRGATGPDASIATDDGNEPSDEIAEVANGSIPVVVLTPPGGDALASDVGLPSAGLASSSTVDSQGVTVTTPEPGSLILLGSGLLYSAARRGRRRR